MPVTTRNKKILSESTNANVSDDVQMVKDVPHVVVREHLRFNDDGVATVDVIKVTTTKNNVVPEEVQDVQKDCMEEIYASVVEESACEEIDFTTYRQPVRIDTKSSEYCGSKIVFDNEGNDDDLSQDKEVPQDLTEKMSSVSLKKKNLTK